MSSIDPFFSIVLPSYNRAHILPKTIGSVLDQTFTNWELIVVDDGSIDDTKNLVEKIEDERVKYIYQHNQERSVARNNGINNATGQYICFLDSDDLFEPQHLQVLFNDLSSRDFPKELFFTNCFYLNHGIKEKPDLPELKENSVVYLLENSVIPARVCIHKDILRVFKFRTDVVIVEDTVLWVTIANKFPVRQIKDYTVQYRLHDDNSVNIKNNCFAPRLDGLTKLFQDKEIQLKAGRKVMRNILSDCYIGIYRHYDYKKNNSRKIGILLTAIVKYPDVKFKMKLYLLLSSLPITSSLIRLKESR
jgi:glycosyltransferase involved in cell wall biosynthesis